VRRPSLSTTGPSFASPTRSAYARQVPPPRISRTSTSLGLYLHHLSHSASLSASTLPIGDRLAYSSPLVLGSPGRSGDGGRGIVYDLARHSSVGLSIRSNYRSNHAWTACDGTCDSGDLVLGCSRIAEDRGDLRTGSFVLRTTSPATYAVVLISVAWYENSLPVITVGFPRCEASCSVLNL